MANVSGLKLLGVGTNAKTTKGDGSEYLTAIMYLAPADLIATNTVCAYADLAGCKAGCLFSAGRGAFNNVQEARARKTRWYEQDREGFMAQLVADLERFEAYCRKRGIVPCVRLNGTSDIPFERIEVKRGDYTYPSIMEAFPAVQFYDYTKVVSRFNRPLPSNYHLTLSYSEASPRYLSMVVKAIEANPSINIAVVVRNKAQARGLVDNCVGFYNRRPIDGDKDDLRFLDPAGSAVILYAKGDAKKDTSGFVVDID